MRWDTYFLALFLLLAPAAARSRPAVDDSPAFTTVPELAEAFHLLYAQQFSEARDEIRQLGIQ